MKAAVLVGTPIYTLARYRGMGDAPNALRKAGLVSALGRPADTGDVALPPLKQDLIEERVKNLSRFREDTLRIFRGTRELQAERVCMVGGECSLTVGTLAGLRELFKGKPGMLWLDSHGDFNTPETSPSGYIGGMCLAMACGRGPKLGLEFEWSRPLLSEERLVHVGSRALDPAEALAFKNSPAKLISSAQARMGSAAELAQEAARRLADRSDWIVCHLDVDVVDPSEIPSVNYPTPGGLTMDQAAMFVRAVLKTEKMRVLELAAYNASLDKDGASARSVVSLVRAIFERGD